MGMSENQQMAQLKQKLALALSANQALNHALEVTQSRFNQTQFGFGMVLRLCPEMKMVIDKATWIEMTSTSLVIDRAVDEKAETVTFFLRERNEEEMKQWQAMQDQLKAANDSKIQIATPGDIPRRTQ